MNTCRALPSLLCLLLPALSQTIASSAPTAPPAHTAPKSAAGGAELDEQDKTFPAQASVAAKTAFDSIPAAAPAVKTALDAHALATAQKLLGKDGAFQGTVSKVYVPHGNGRVVLDFAPHYHDALTAVIKPDAYAKFPDLNLLLGKRVLILGKFTAYHERPEVDLVAPAQLRVIAEK